MGAMVLLNPDETHHLKNVLRIREGSLCLLFDREGNEFVSRIEHFRSDARSEARLLEPFTPRHRSFSLELTVAQAIPQDRKMDDIVQKSAELGILELIPLVTERTIARITSSKFEKVYSRWRRICEQTLKQSRIQKSPKIAAPASFDSLCSRLSKYEHVFLLHPTPDAQPIRECLSSAELVQAKRSTSQILLMIGPEGGFSPNEIKHAEALGAKIVKMGSGILKTDTAFVAAVSFFNLMYE